MQEVTGAEPVAATTTGSGRTSGAYTFTRNTPMPMTFEDGRYRDHELTLASHSYRGRSIGSEQTCHQFPGHGVMFDVGGAPLSSTVIPNVFVTHGHDDHVGGLGSHHLRRNGWGMDAARYFVQEEDVKLVRAMVQAQCDLNRSRALRNIEIIGVGEGSDIPVGKGGLSVRPFRSTHRIPCLGYALWGKRKRRKEEYRSLSERELGDLMVKPEYRGLSHGALNVLRLKPEYRDLSQGALRRLRGAGTDVNDPAFDTKHPNPPDINEEYELPEVAFPGDTNLSILNKPAGDVVRKARVLLLECTFIDDEVSPRDTFRTGHIHIEDFIAAARDGAFENEVILLTHFSARYAPDYVRETVTKRLAGEAIWPRVKLLLPELRQRS